MLIVMLIETVFSSGISSLKKSGDGIKFAITARIILWIDLNLNSVPETF